MPCVRLWAYDWGELTSGWNFASAIEEAYFLIFFFGGGGLISAFYSTLCVPRRRTG